MFNDNISRRLLLARLAHKSIALALLGQWLDQPRAVARPNSHEDNKKKFVRSIILSESVKTICHNEKISDLFIITAFNKYLSVNPLATSDALGDYYKRVTDLIPVVQTAVKKDPFALINTVTLDPIANTAPHPKRKDERLFDFIKNVLSRTEKLDPILESTCWELSKLFCVNTLLQSELYSKSALILQEEILASSFMAELGTGLRSNGARLIEMSDQIQRTTWVNDKIFEPITGLSLNSTLDQIVASRPALTADPVFEAIVTERIPIEFDKLPVHMPNVVDTLDKILAPAKAVKDIFDKVDSDSFGDFNKIAVNLQSSSFSLGLLTSVIELSGHGSLAKKVSDVGGAAIKIATQLSDYVSKGSFSLGGLAANLLSGNIFGTALSVAGLGAPSPSEVEKKMLEKLDNIQSGIADIKKGLAAIDTKLNVIQLQIDQVLHEQRAGFRDLRSSIREIGAEIISVLTEIRTIEQDGNYQLNILGNYISELVASLATEQREQAKQNYYLHFKEKWNVAFDRDRDSTLSATDFDSCSAVFYTYAKDVSVAVPFHKQHHGRADLDSLYDVLFESGQPVPVWTNLRVIASFSNRLFGHTAANPGSTMNPLIYAVGVEAYLQLVERFKPPDFNVRRVDHLIAHAEKLSDWFSTFGYEKIKGDPNKLPAEKHSLRCRNGKYLVRRDFINSLNNNYSNAVKSLYGILNEELTKFETLSENNLISRSKNSFFTIRLAFKDETERATIKSLELSYAMMRRDLSDAMPEQLPLPSNMLDYIPHVYLVNDILRGNKGKGFKFLYYIDNHDFHIEVMQSVVDRDGQMRDRKVSTIIFEVDLNKEPIPENYYLGEATKYDTNTPSGFSEWWNWQLIQLPYAPVYRSQYTLEEYDFHRRRYSYNRRDDGKIYRDSSILIRTNFDALSDVSSENEAMIRSLEDKFFNSITAALLRDADAHYPNVSRAARHVDASAQLIKNVFYLLAPGNYDSPRLRTAADIAKNLSWFDQDGNLSSIFEVGNLVPKTPDGETVAPAVVTAVMMKLKTARAILEKA